MSSGDLVPHGLSAMANVRESVPSHAEKLAEADKTIAELSLNDEKKRTDIKDATERADIEDASTKESDGEAVYIVRSSTKTGETKASKSKNSEIKDTDLTAAIVDEQAVVEKRPEKVSKGMHKVGDTGMQIKFIHSDPSNYCKPCVS